MGIPLTMLGVGVGMNISTNCNTDAYGHENSSLLPTWSMHHRTRTEVQLDDSTHHKKISQRWRNFQDRAMKVLDQSMPLHHKLEFMEEYRSRIFLQFERVKDCGKPINNGERRCLHHVISPLDFNITTHEQDFQHVHSIHSVKVQPIS